MRKTLKNGAKVLCYREDRSGSIVLAENSMGDFVTWLVDDDGNAYHGHYFENYKEAMTDFLGR